MAQNDVFEYIFEKVGYKNVEFVKIKNNGVFKRKFISFLIIYFENISKINLQYMRITLKQSFGNLYQKAHIHKY